MPQPIQKQDTPTDWGASGGAKKTASRPLNAALTRRNQNLKDQGLGAGEVAAGLAAAGFAGAVAAFAG